MNNHESNSEQSTGIDYLGAVFLSGLAGEARMMVLQDDVSGANHVNYGPLAVRFDNLE